MEKSTVGLRKRQQISRANRMMLLWIAGISVVVGVSIVLILFLAQKIWFGEKVIAEKNKTVSTLEKNLAAVDDLKNNIRVLNTNENLKSTRPGDSASPLQSVLDALPADANSTALASSLQTKLLTGIPGIVIDTISVDPVVGSETDATDGATSAAGSNEINFSFSVSADTDNYTALRQVLERLEKSIRPFNVADISVEGQGNKVIMTVKGVSYYQLAQVVQLTNKVVKP